MGADGLRARLTSSGQQLDQVGRQQRYQGLDVTPIGDAALRTPVRVGGRVTALEVVAGASAPALEVTLADGTGEAVAVFTGCRHKGGVEVGRDLLLEGVARHVRGRLVLLNPAYTLLAG